MKTLHIINTLANGGAQFVLAQLLENWGDDRERQVVISLSSPGQLSGRIEAMGISVEHLHMQPGMVDLTKFLDLVRILRMHQPDVIQTWLYHSDLIGSATAFLARRASIVWGVHHTTANIRSLKPSTANLVRVLSILSRWLPSRIICCSHSAYQTHLALGYPNDKMTVIPNGIDTARFQIDVSARGLLRSELGLLDDVRLIGMFARYHPQKDHRTFIRAAGILHKRMPNVHFVLAGEGVDTSNGHLWQQILDEDVQNHVHLLGNRQDMPRLTASLDVATLSSAHGEALPLALGEAMACEVPCVATDVGDTATLIGKTGGIVEPINPQSLADGWQSVLELPGAEYKDLGARARRRILEFYNLKNMVNMYKAVYWEVNNIR